MDISAIASYVQPKEFQILVNGILQLVKVQIEENHQFQSTTNIAEYDLLIEKMKSLNHELEVHDLQNIIHVVELVSTDAVNSLTRLTHHNIDREKSCNRELVCGCSERLPRWP